MPVKSITASKASAVELRKRLTSMIRKTQPYTKRIAHQGICVEPELLAEIEYRGGQGEISALQGSAGGTLMQSYIRRLAQLPFPRLLRVPSNLEQCHTVGLHTLGSFGHMPGTRHGTRMDPEVDALSPEAWVHPSSPSCS
jgi:hypothetical protein